MQFTSFDITIRIHDARYSTFASELMDFICCCIGKCHVRHPCCGAFLLQHLGSFRKLSCEPTASWDIHHHHGRHTCGIIKRVTTKHFVVLCYFWYIAVSLPTSNLPLILPCTMQLASFIRAVHLSSYLFFLLLHDASFNNPTRKWKPSLGDSPCGSHPCRFPEKVLDREICVTFIHHTPLVAVDKKDLCQ